MLVAIPLIPSSFGSHSNDGHQVIFFFSSEPQDPGVENVVHLSVEEQGAKFVPETIPVSFQDFESNTHSLQLTKGKCANSEIIASVTITKYDKKYGIQLCGSRGSTYFFDREKLKELGNEQMNELKFLERRNQRPKNVLDRHANEIADVKLKIEGL